MGTYRGQIACGISVLICCRESSRRARRSMALQTWRSLAGRLRFPSRKLLTPGQDLVNACKAKRQLPRGKPVRGQCWPCRRPLLQG